MRRPLASLPLSLLLSLAMVIPTIAADPSPSAEASTEPSVPPATEPSPSVPASTARSNSDSFPGLTLAVTRSRIGISALSSILPARTMH